MPEYAKTRWHMQPPSHAVRREGAQGYTLVWKLGSNVQACCVHGLFCRAQAQLLVDEVDALLSTASPVHVFLDWSGMASYESESRIMLTKWAWERRARVSFHILVGSRMVAMGVTVANLALGGLLHDYTRREDLEAALAQVLLESRRA